ncbi:MAG: VWA domain-containing protein [Deltaproteobacteria bacterium]|nr:VWA domain-containing protein [Deltaproteobacteria bacterium]
MFKHALLIALAVIVPAAAQAEKCPAELPVLFVVQDKSGTMADPPDASCPSCPSKWTTAKAAVKNLSQQYANRFRFGVQMYPRDTTTFNCSTGTTVTPFPASSDDVAAAYSAASPGGGTPTAVSLDAAKTYLQARHLTEPAYALLLTDGLPNCNLSLNQATCTPSQPACAGSNGLGSPNCGAKGCLDDQGATSAAARLLAAGYKVYVVGFDATLSANVNRAVLDGMAAAGGTGQAYTADDSASLNAALAAIAFDATTCCKDVCQNGAAQCLANGQVQRCQIDAGGECTNWTVSDCPPASACTNGSCVACQNECAVDATRCSGNSAMKCQMQPSGCTAWVTIDDCGWGEKCVNGVCESCDECNQGEEQCVGASEVKTCDLDWLSGCSQWSTEPCPNGTTCEGGACLGCAHTCRAGERRCTGQTPEACVADSQGCTEWTAGTPCTDFCSGGVCGACGTTCTLNAARCNGNTVEMCTQDANGCTIWSANGPCLPDQFCSDGACQTCPVRCTVGEKQCGANGILECQPQASGCNAWVAAGACAEGETCRDGHCVPPCQNLCDTGAVTCDTQGAPMKCELAPTGCSVWKASPACVGENQRCIDGVCRERCSGAEIETCSEGMVCTGVPEGSFCLPADGSPDAGTGGPGTLPGIDDPSEEDPGTTLKPGSKAGNAPDGGCGCGATSSGAALFTLAPMAFTLLRRRRG